MGSPLISVLICTYNPKREYLNRVLEALRAQSLPLAEWELVIIDSKCDEGALDGFDTSWHPSARIVQADRPGLAAARISGIKSARAGLIAFVDDDNVLAPEYLGRVLDYGLKWPMLGAWGGQSVAEFEIEPPAFLSPFLYMLGIVQLQRSKWSNLNHVFWTTPIGAGMCIRKTVCDSWLLRLQQSPERAEFTRVGNSLLTGEDWDMAMTSTELGLGTAIFQDLQFTHLIKKERIDWDYLLRLARDTEYSVTMIKYYLGILVIPYLEARLVEHLSAWRLPRRERLMQRARRLGFEKALKEIKRIKNSASN